MTDPWATFDLPPAAVDVWRMEATCRRMWVFEPLTVPGLLQTPEYTRALLAGINSPPLSPDAVEAIGGARKARQTLLVRPDGPEMRFLVDQPALRRLVGSQAVMLAQLDRIEEVAAGGVSVQVVPAGSPAHPGMRGAFWIADDQVYFEGPPGDHFGPAGDWPAVFEQIAGLASRPEDLPAVLDRIRAELQ